MNLLCVYFVFLKGICFWIIVRGFEFLFMCGVLWFDVVFVIDVEKLKVFVLYKFYYELKLGFYVVVYFYIVV